MATVASSLVNEMKPMIKEIVTRALGECLPRALDDRLAGANDYHVKKERDDQALTIERLKQEKKDAEDKARREASRLQAELEKAPEIVDLNDATNEATGNMGSGVNEETSTGDCADVVRGNGDSRIGERAPDFKLYVNFKSLLTWCQSFSLPPETVEQVSSC